MEAPELQPEAHDSGATLHGLPVAILSDEQVRKIILSSNVLEHTSDVISIVDADMRFVYLSRVVGARSHTSVVGSYLGDHMTEATRISFSAAFKRAWDLREPEMLEGMSDDGIWWESRLSPIVDADGGRYMLCLSSDITPRKRAEAALRGSEGRLRDAIQVSGLGTWRWDMASGGIDCDEGLCKIVGFTPETAPTTFSAFEATLHPDDRAWMIAHVMRAMDTGECAEVEHRFVRPTGEVRIVSCRGSVIYDAAGRLAGMQGGVFDVTERRALEERLRHAHKMEAIGQLTAGIAHNFNNLLSIVLPNVELTRPLCPPEVQGRLDDIAHAAQRAADMVRQLMLFARREAASVKSSCDLASLARSTVRICRATFDPRIAIEFDVSGDFPRIWAAAGEIEQVLLNICINARDALTPIVRDDATIRVRIADLRNGQARISISDNGQGMDEDTRARIFEPFFTTKGTGYGTGLGLASAYGIIADHRGSIRCASTPRAGTTFTIDLPTALEQPTAPAVQGTTLWPVGTETLLLVDDEPMVRRALKAVLEGAGFQVLTAEDGQQGLAVLEKTPAAVRLVVLDRAMPRSSGDQFLSRLRASGSTLPVVLLTGQPGLDADALGASAILLKPPSTGELLRLIRGLLDDESSRFRAP